MRTGAAWIGEERHGNAGVKRLVLTGLDRVRQGNVWFGKAGMT